MFRKLLNSELGRADIDQYKQLEKLPITIVLDNVRSRHNIGSAFRTSDAFRVNEIILCGISSTPPSAEIHKSALGAEHSVDWEHVQDTMEAVRKLKEDGYVIVSAEQTVDSVMLDTFVPDQDQKYAVVFGNEVAGVSQEVVDASDFALEIPQFGTKHSLNVSVTAGIVIWEFFKSLHDRMT